MIYVNVEAVKSEGRGVAGGNGWFDTDDVTDAIGRAVARHRRMWDSLGHGAITEYRITVATEASPHRTMNGLPLPAREEASDVTGEQEDNR